MATALEPLVTFDFWQNFCEIKESTATVKPNAAMESNKCWRHNDRGRMVRTVDFLTALMVALWEKMTCLLLNQSVNMDLYISYDRHPIYEHVWQIQ